MAREKLETKKSIFRILLEDYPPGFVPHCCLCNIPIPRKISRLKIEASNYMDVDKTISICPKCIQELAKRTKEGIPAMEESMIQHVATKV